MVGFLLDEKADINSFGESNSANLTCAVLSRYFVIAKSSFFPPTAEFYGDTTYAYFLS